MPDNKISIPVYNFIRKDQNRAGGSVVLYIWDNAAFYDREADLVPSSLEMVCAEINRLQGKSFLGISLQTRTWTYSTSARHLFSEVSRREQRVNIIR